MTGLRIVGLDLSLTATGVAPHHGPPITIGSDLRGAERLAELQRRIVAHIRGVDLAVIEGYAYGRHNRAHQIGELGGIIRLACWHQRIPYVEVPPATLKKFATGKGNAGKDDMLVAAIRRLDYQGASHNEADALWLHQLALHGYRNPARHVLPKAQTAVADGIDWPDLEEAP